MSRIHIVKMVIETQSPLSIAAGIRETGFDTELIRDVNHLPVIPATAIAGVWRGLCQQNYGDELANTWFGTIFQRSKLAISNARLLNKKGELPQTYCPENEIADDEILKLCHQNRPHHRERVAINDRGAAKNKGKYDQILLPKGIRFALTLHWNSENNELGTGEWQKLQALWLDRRFAFGSSTRNGLGQIKIVSYESRAFDLSLGSGSAEQMRKFKSQLARQAPDFTMRRANTSILLAEIPLKAKDNWRCGRGIELLNSKNGSDHKSVAIISYSEPVVKWQNGHASVIKNQPMLCGSGVKGMIAHRLAYHYRKHSGEWSESLAEAGSEQWSARPQGLNELLGFAADNSQNAGQAGQFYIDDSEIDYQHTILRHHNSIDRFTGGVRQGALYTEELLYQPEFTLRLWVNNKLKLNEKLKKALQDTIEDIRSGMLPIGAGSGRGASLIRADLSKNVQINLDAISDPAEGAL